jgi:uncharacterized protein (DUF924 family)
MSEIGWSEVLDFWFDETPRESWFKLDPAFDALVRSRFESLWRAAAAGSLESWENDASGSLALVIVLDQFPRNMFRGRAEAYATDALACAVAKRAIERGYDLKTPAGQRSFFYLPFMHSEDIADQETCVRVTRERLGETHYSYPFAVKHRDVIERFGRFPARNRALARSNTPEESHFLALNPSGL